MVAAAGTDGGPRLRSGPPAADNTLVTSPRARSTKQKAYAAALAVALGVLAYDKGWSSGPTPVRGAAVPVAEAAAQPVAAAGGVTPDAALPTAGLADRLRALAADPTADVRDAFAPAAAWAGDRRSDPAAGAADADAFRAGHRLSVVLVAAGGGGSAVIGGRLVRVGQAIDGYRLTAVRPRSARLVGPAGAAVDLRMP